MSHLTTSPDLALLLVVLGMFSLYLELLRPGSIVPGIFGAILVMFGLSGFMHADWRGAALLLLAFGCLLGDAFRPAGNLLNICAAAAFCAGVMIAEPRIHTVTALLTLLPFTLVTSYLLKIAVRARRNKTFGFRAPRYPVKE